MFYTIETLSRDYPGVKPYAIFDDGRCLSMHQTIEEAKDAVYTLQEADRERRALRYNEVNC